MKNHQTPPNQNKNSYLITMYAAKLLKIKITEHLKLLYNIKIKLNFKIITIIIDK